MKTIAIILICIQCLQAGIGQIPPGYKKIFNGKNLRGWHVSRSTHQGTTLEPKIENKSIILDQNPFGQGGVLLSNKKFSNFELYLEVHIDSFSNGGIFLRSNEGGAAYQIEMSLPGSHCHLFGERIPCSVPGIPKNTDSLWKVNDWNKLRIRMTGEIPTITVWLNDSWLYSVKQTKNDFIGQDTKGSIGFQCHWTSVYSTAAGKGMPIDSWRPGSKHRYRNIGIKEL